MKYSKGYKQGKLLVLSEAKKYVSPKGQKARVVECECDCGKIILIRTSNLTKGYKSCGCLSLKHGLKKHKLYNTWNLMMQRCQNKKHPAYKNYGGRGIKVCRRWQNIENFIKDMGEKKEKMTLERIKNGDGYSKENCRWASRREQANNKRNSRFLEYKGEKLTVAQWVRKTGIKNIYRRVFNYGWSVEKALTK